MCMQAPGQMPSQMDFLTKAEDLNQEERLGNQLWVCFPALHLFAAVKPSK